MNPTNQEPVPTTAPNIPRTASEDFEQPTLPVPNQTMQELVDAWQQRNREAEQQGIATSARPTRPLALHAVARKRMRAGTCYGFFPVYRTRIVKNTWWNYIRASKHDRHTIVDVKPNTVTLCFMGPKTREWGFHTERGWVLWKDYYAKQRAEKAAFAERQAKIDCLIRTEGLS